MKSLRIRSNSLFGNCPEIYRKRVAHWKNRNEYKGYDFLVVDDKDGRLCMCPLRSGREVTVYEPNEIYLYGGKQKVPIKNLENNEIVFKDKTTMGLQDRLNLEFLENNAVIYNENFYEAHLDNKYGFVAASKSLDRIENKNISMSDKIEKLKDVVQPGGYLYIEYYIALDENDYESYPENQYMRYGEMEKFFKNEDWSILSIQEKPTTEDITKMNPESKKIIFGIIDARRKKENNIRKPRMIHKLNTNIPSRVKKVRNYVINGVVR